MTHPNHERVLGFFTRREQRSRALAGALVQDADAVVEEARGIYEQMIPTMAYVDEPDLPMAGNLFDCNVLLALFLSLRTRGVDAHAMGRAMLAGIANSRPEPPPADPDRPRDTRTPLERFQAFIAAGEASQREGKPGQFVFEAYVGDRKETDWGMNVKSCAICHSFGKHDAMDLVPYMCASDDLMSDRDGAGLRRSGTLALGADRCDFKYKKGGDPVRLVELYPDRIRASKA